MKEAAKQRVAFVAGSKERSGTTSGAGRLAYAVHSIKTPRRVGPRAIWFYIVLFLATWTVYSQVRRFDFVDYDDPDYVGNPHVLGGLTGHGVIWALTSGEAANWFPVTRISHLLDAQWFGKESGPQHLTNAFIHALAALLLFAFLHRATGARWRSFLVAFLFALHPLHVESVAWVAERKDVLCAFFWFLTLWAYVRYTERRDFGRYLFVVVSFGLGLMSKAMIVTLPFVLLMLDAWPLERLRIRGGAISWKKAIGEKVPLLALATVCSAIAFLTQRSSGAVEALKQPLGVRAENALVSYAIYIGKMFWPTRLALLYPYPASIPGWEVAVAGVILAAITMVTVWWIRVRPYLAAGWFWYLGTLVPVIGLVPIGVQARADRYTYIPMVGLSIMLAWGLASAVKRWPRARTFTIVCVATACILYAAATWVQLQYWTNSETLFRRALAVTDGNYIMHLSLGATLGKTPGGAEEAISEYRAALRTKPDFLQARCNLANILRDMPGRLPDAIAEYETALQAKPSSSAQALDMAVVHNNLGVALGMWPGRLAEAISEYQAAVRINPDFLDAHTNLAGALADSNRLAEAVAEYRAALRLRPDAVETRKKLAGALARIPGRLPEAISAYRAVLILDPASIEAHNGIADALLQMPGNIGDAIAEYEAALRIRPGSAELHNNLGNALAKEPGRAVEAIAQYQAAIAIRPAFPEAHYNLAGLLSNIPGRRAEAIAHLEGLPGGESNPAVRQLMARLRSAGSK